MGSVCGGRQGACNNVGGPAREVWERQHVSQKSFMDGDVLVSYFFRLTQVAYFSISVCCMNDFENENGVKIENGIRSLGNKSRSGLRRMH